MVCYSQTQQNGADPDQTFQPVRIFRFIIQFISVLRSANYKVTLITTIHAMVKTSGCSLTKIYWANHLTGHFCFLGKSYLCEWIKIHLNKKTFLDVLIRLAKTKAILRLKRSFLAISFLKKTTTTKKNKKKQQQQKKKKKKKNNNNKKKKKKKTTKKKKKKKKKYKKKNKQKKNKKKTKKQNKKQTNKTKQKKMLNAHAHHFSMISITKINSHS